MSHHMRTVLAAVLLVSVLAPTALAAPPVVPTGAVEPVYAPPWPSGGQRVHVVQLGDTLTRIASRYGTTIWAIAQANGISNVDYIRIGQLLVIPGFGPWMPGPTGCPHWYTVRAGDTLTKIAWSHGTSVWAIVQANGIWDANYIQIGQVLHIPC